MGLTQTSAPAVEPLSTAEAKKHLKVEFADEDTLIDSLIVAARIMAEAYTVRQLITATYTLTLRDFPGGFGKIDLSPTPLGSVSSITYLDTSGTSQTLATSVYEAVTDDVSAKVVLKPSQVWPSVQSGKYETVTVTFTAGYGAAGSNVPESARTGMLLLIGDFYHNRGDENNINTHPTARALLNTVSVRLVA